MHRRPLGRGRALVIVASAIMLIACLLPWFGTGGGSDLPARELRAFDGSGILVFLAALLTLALVSLPYALVDRPVGLDAWPAFSILLAVAVAGLVIWPIDLVGVYAAGLIPDRAPGYALAILGTLIYARAVYDIHQEPPRR
jgi:hypothetical protein